MDKFIIEIGIAVVFLLWICVRNKRPVWPAILGFFYPVVSFIVDILLLDLLGPLNFPFISLTLFFILFLVTPVVLIVFFWNRIRSISTGLIISTVLISPFIFFGFIIAKDYDFNVQKYNQKILKLEQYKVLHGRYPEADPDCNPNKKLCNSTRYYYDSTN